MFDWLDFLDEHDIEYRTSGKSTKAGNAYIRCPFCEDPGDSQLMGVSMTNSFWGCWRRDQCSGYGKSPARLIVALLGCSLDHARSLCGQSVVGDEEYREKFQAAMRSVHVGNKSLRKFHELPEYEIDFPYEPLDRTNRAHRRAFSYLAKKRDMDPEIAETLDLGFCPVNRSRDSLIRRMGNRIVLPIRELSGRLVGVQGRDLGDSVIRYDTRPGGLIDAVFGSHRAQEGGRLLVIVEGPFDALVLEHAAVEYGIAAHAVALMGLNFSKKVRRLSRLAANFEKTVSCFDASERLASMRFQELVPFQCGVGRLPEGVKDTGELLSADAARFLEKLAS